MLDRCVVAYLWLDGGDVLADGEGGAQVRGRGEVTRGSWRGPNQEQGIEMSFVTSAATILITVLLAAARMKRSAPRWLVADILLAALKLPADKRFHAHLFLRKACRLHCGCRNAAHHLAHCS